MPGFNPNFNPDFNPDAVAPKFNAAFNPDFDPDVEAKPAKTSDGTIVAAPASVQDVTSIKGLPRFATIQGGSRFNAPAGGLQKVIDQNRAAREAQVERLASQGMPREQAETYEVGALSGLSPEAWQETLAQDEARRKSAPLRAFEGAAHGVATPIVNLANAPSGLVREAGKIAESAGLDKAGKRIQAAGQAIRPTEARRVLEETAPLTEVGQVADFAGHIAGLVPTLGVLGMSGFATQSAGNTMNEALDSGAGAGKALAAGLGQAAKDVVLMKAARLVPALQTRNPAVGALVNSMSTNAGLGLALTYGGNLIDKATWDPKRKVFDGTKDALTTGLAFGLLHAPQAMRAAEYRRMASEHPGGVEGFMAELQAKKDLLAKTAGEMDRTVTLDPKGNRVENYDRMAFERVNGSVLEALRVARSYRDSLLKQGKLKEAMGTGQVNESQAPPPETAVPPTAGPLPVVTPTTPSEAPRVEAPLPSPPAGPEGPVAQSGAPLTVAGEAPGVPAQPDAGSAPAAGGGGGGEPVGTPPVEVSALAEQAQELDVLARQLAVRAAEHPTVEQAQVEAQEAADLAEEAKARLDQVAPEKHLLAPPAPTDAPTELSPAQVEPPPPLLPPSQPLSAATPQEPMPNERNVHTAMDEDWVQSEAKKINLALPSWRPDMDTGAFLEKRAEALARNPSGFLDLYRALPETMGGKLIDGDALDMLLKGNHPEHYDLFNKVKWADPEQEMFYDAHATKLYNLLLRNTLDQPAKPGEHFIVTMGAPGSGKSTAVRQIIKESGDAIKGVIDTPGRNISEIDKVIRKARKNGYLVDLVFVKRPVEDAVPAVMFRTKREARGLSPADISELGLVHATKNVPTLIQRFRDSPGVNIQVIENHTGQPYRLAADLRRDGVESTIRASKTGYIERDGTPINGLQLAGRAAQAYTRTRDTHERSIHPEYLRRFDTEVEALLQSVGGVRETELQARRDGDHPGEPAEGTSPGGAIRGGEIPGGSGPVPEAPGQRKLEVAESVPQAIAKHSAEQPIKGVVHGGPDEILQLVDAPKKPGRQAVRYLDVDEASAQRLQDASEGAVRGVDGFHHTVDKDALIHAMTQHGDPGLEARRNQQPLVKEDFARLPEIVSEPDEVVYQGKTKGLARFLYKKAFNGTTFFVEEVRRSRHELAAVTLWKVPTRVLMQGSPAPNLRPSDVSDGRPPQGKPNSMPDDGIGKAEADGLGFTVDGEKHQIPADRADLIGRLQAAKDAMEKRQADISAKTGVNVKVRAIQHKKAGDEFADVKRKIRDAMIEESTKGGEIPKGLRGIPGLKPSGGVYQMPTAQIHADPTRFQYKKQNETTGIQQVNRKTGATGSLLGVKVWSPESAGVLDVWRDPQDRKVYVVNGHNRFDKAMELGVPSLKVRFIEAKNEKEARAQGAIHNLSEGHGTALDAATYFRDSGLGEKDLVEKGVPASKSVIQDGLALASLPVTWTQAAASDPELMRLAVETGKAGLNAKQADIAFRELHLILGKKDSSDVTTSFWKDSLERIKASHEITTGQVNLFGEEDYQSTLEQQTDLIRHIRSKLKADVQAGNVLTGKRYQDAVGQAASVDSKKAHNVKQEASSSLSTFEQQKHFSPIGDIINEHATRLAQAGSAREGESIRSSALEAVRESLRRDPQGAPDRPDGGRGEVDQGGGSGKGQGPLFDEGSPLEVALRASARDAAASKVIRPQDGGDGPSEMHAFSNPLAAVLGNIFGTRQRPDAISVPSAFEEVERRWREAKKGAESTPMLTKAIESLRRAKAAFTRHFDHIDPNESPLMAQVHDLLRQYEAGPAFAKAVAHDMVYEVTKGLGPKRIDLFTRILALRDIIRNVNDGLDDAAEELPFGYKNLEEAEHDLSRFEGILNEPDNAPVREALQRRQDHASAIVETLVNHDLLPKETLDNVESYYHRQVMTYLNNRSVGATGGDVRMKRKGFQIARQGGANDFNAAYEQAEAEWVADAMSLIVKKETLDRIEKTADLSSKLEVQADLMNREAYSEIHPNTDPNNIAEMSSLEIRQGLGEQAVNWRDLVPEGYTLWQPAKGNHFYPALTVSERLLDKFLEGEADLSKDDFKSVLAVGAKKKQWAIPQNIATQLDNFVDRDASEFGRFWVGLQSSWKQWQLISPMRIGRYSLNNMMGDLDIAVAYDPRIVSRHFGKAASDMWAYQVTHSASPALVKEVQDAIRRGVVESGITIAEIPDIDKAGAFRLLTSDRPNGNLVQKLWGGLKTFSTWRENILRLAAYRFFQEELAKGRNLYAASNRAQVDAITNQKDKAAKLARELIGDYGNVSVAGQYIRTHMIPFYSWMEVNAPRYVRLLKNLPREGEPRPGDGKERTRIGMVGRTMLAKAPGLALRWAAVFGLIYLFNQFFFKDEYEELRRQKGFKNGLILGRREDGSIRYVRMDLAITDALEWLSASDLGRKIEEVHQGKETWGDIAADAAKGPAEKIIKGWEPFSKTLFELVLGRSISYPSVWREGASLKPGGMAIRDKVGYALKNVTPLDRLWNKVTNKPERPSGLADGAVDALLAYSVDPGEASYFLSRDIANEWMKKNMKREEFSGTANITEKGNALYYFKRASQWGDEERAAYWLGKYYDLGGRPKGIRESIKHGHPLGAIPPARRARFLGSLNENDREVITDAIAWYQRLNPEAQSIMAGPSKNAGTQPDGQ